MRRRRHFIFIVTLILIASTLAAAILASGVHGQPSGVQPYLYRPALTFESGKVVSASVSFPLFFYVSSAGGALKAYLRNLESGETIGLGPVPPGKLVLTKIFRKEFFVTISSSQAQTSLKVFSPWGPESVSLPGSLLGMGNESYFLFLLLHQAPGIFSLACVDVPSAKVLWNVQFLGPRPEIENETVYALWQLLSSLPHTVLPTSQGIYVFFPFGYLAKFSYSGREVYENFNSSPAGLFSPQALLVSSQNWSEVLIPGVSLGGSPEIEAVAIPSLISKSFQLDLPGPGMGTLVNSPGGPFLIWLSFPSTEALLSESGGVPYGVRLIPYFLAVGQYSKPCLLPFVPQNYFSLGKTLLLSSQDEICAVDPVRDQVMWEEQIPGEVVSSFGLALVVSSGLYSKVLVPYGLRAAGSPLLPMQRLSWPYISVFSYSGAWRLVPPGDLYFSLRGENWSKSFSPPEVPGPGWALVSLSKEGEDPLEEAYNGSLYRVATVDYYYALPYSPSLGFEYSPEVSFPGQVLAKVSMGAGTEACLSWPYLYVYGPEGVAKVYLPGGKEVSSVEVPATSGCVFEGNFYYLSSGTLYEYPKKEVASFSSSVPFSEALPTPLGILLLAPSSGKACLLDPSKGEVLFSISLPGVIYSSCWGSGNYYFLTPAGVVAFSPRGREVWFLPLKASSLCFASQYLVAASGQEAYLISPSSGEVLEEVSLPSGGKVISLAYDPFTEEILILQQENLISLSVRTLVLKSYFSVPFSPKGLLATQSGIFVYGSGGVFFVGPGGAAERVLPISSEGVMLAPGRFVALDPGQVLIYGAPPLSAEVSSSSSQVGKLIEVKVFTRNLTGGLCPARLYISGEGALIYLNGKYYKDLYANSSGVYTFNVTSFQAGQAKVKVKAELPEGNFTAAVSLFFFHGPPKDLRLFLTQNTIKAGASIEAVAVLTDQYGNPIQGAAVKFTIGDRVIGEVMTNEKGIAHVSVEETKAGNYTLVASFSSLSSVAKFTVLPGAPVSLSANVSKQIEAGSYATFRVSVKDAYGNPVPGVPVSIFLSGQKVWSGETDSFGTVVGAFKVEKPGIYVVRVQAGGLHYSSVLIVASARGKMEEISGPGNETEVIAGTMLTYTVAVYDRLGRPVSGSPVEVFVDGHFAFNATAQNGVAVVKVCLKKEGTHEITLYSPLAGAGLTFYVIVVPNVQHVSLSANATWPKEAGGDAVIWLKSSDPYGNPVKELFTVKISGPHGSGEISFYASGLRKIRFPVFVAGTYHVEILCGSKILFRSSFVVMPSRWIVLITPPSDVFASGQNVTIPVSVYDIYHNPVPYANVTVSLGGQSRTYITPPSGTILVSLGTLPVGKYTVKVSCRGVTNYVALTVFPGPPAKLKILFSSSVIAGVKVTLTAQVLDKGGNPEPFIPISNITSKDAECSLVQHYTDRNGTFEFTFYSTLAGPHVVLVNTSGQILNATVWVNPAPGRMISVRMYTLNPQPGQLVMIFYHVTDEYGNPIQGVLPQIVVKGVHYYLKKLMRTNKEGAGYAVAEFTSPGFGTLKVVVNGYSSPPVKFVVGNKEKLMIEAALLRYLPFIILGAIGAAFAGLYVYYQRIERLRSKFI